MFSKLFWKIKKGFTLYELTVVVGIVSVLSGLVYVTVQPAELLARSRDSQRISDINQISALIAQKRTQQVRVRSLGATSTFYISLPSSNPDCSDLLSLLPTIAAGMTYHCVPQSQLRNVDGTGWIPIDFTADKISALPIDSVNTAASGLYYIYANTGASYELSSSLESTQLKDLNASKDGGSNPNAYEAGSSLAAIPNVTSIGGTLPILCSPGVTRTMYNVSSVACGTACASETQTCNGTGTAWSGTYTSGSCTTSTRTAYQALTSACGTYGANNENQTCQSNGSWSGTYTLTSSPSITTQTRYGSLTSACGTYGATSETQSCQSNGSFDGSYTLASPPSATTRTMYAALTSACGTYSYSSENQSCLASGSFSGTYTLSSQPSLTTRTRYAAATSACGTYGSNSQTQTCQSGGSFNGSYTLTSPPSASTRTMYQASSVACGNSCSSQTQTCQSSGSWSGTYAYGSCSVDSCDPCLGVTCDSYCSGTTYYYNGSCSAGSCSYSSSITSGTCGAVCTPGTTRTRYAALSVSCGTAAASETQTCNGSGTGWSGSYTLTSAPTASTRTMQKYATVCVGSCVSETQTCQSSGSWSGTYTNSSCSIFNPVTYYQDSDGDGYGNASVTAMKCIGAGDCVGNPYNSNSCVATGYATNANDCNDTDSSIYPGKTWSIGSCYCYNGCTNVPWSCTSYTCNADGTTTTNPAPACVQDCVPMTIYYRDADGDGYGAGEGVGSTSQPTGWVANNSDCYDSDSRANPNGVWQSFPRADGSWDWNCDGVEQHKWCGQTYAIGNAWQSYTNAPYYSLGSSCVYAGTTSGYYSTTYVMTDVCSVACGQAIGPSCSSSYQYVNSSCSAGSGGQYYNQGGITQQDCQ